MDHSHLVGAILAGRRIIDQSGVRRNLAKEEDRFYNSHGGTMWISVVLGWISRLTS